MKCRECQVEKRIAAKGLCSTCYSKALQKEKSAVCLGCGEFKPIKGKGLCPTCYMSLQRNGDLIRRKRKKKGDTLCIYCKKEPMHAKGYCKSCYQRFRATGSPEYKRAATHICRVPNCKNKATDRGFCDDHQHYIWDDRKAKNGHLERKYQMTIEDYEKMYDEQNGVCKICGQPETKKYNGKVVELAVDHCHETGKVRGLLCNKCNVALGGFQDSPTLLASALNYLNRVSRG